jgi:opacity protein-like surface antigen
MTKQKTKILTLILFGLLFSNVYAQDDAFSNDPVAKLPDEDRKFRFGLQFSPNVSWFKARTDGYESDGTKMGFSYGLSFEYFLTKNYLFSTGLTLLNSGGNLKYESAATYVNYRSGFPRTSAVHSIVEVEYKLKYIEIPFMLKMKTNEIGYFTYFGQFGFKAGVNYRSSSTNTVSYNPSGTEFIETAPVDRNDVSDEINFMNLSLAVGIGVEYNLSGNTNLMLGITFNNGFINQLDMKVPELDANGNPFLISFESVALSEKEASANLNYFSLNLGIYF